MMHRREKEVGVAKDIELTSIQEFDTESRKSMIKNEETGEDRWQALKKTFYKSIPTKSIIWRFLKFIVFIICITFAIIQSLEFYNIYNEYPTNMVQKSIFIKKVQLPAVTVCLKYTISTRLFCHIHREWCERPKNLEEFCKKYPFHCRDHVLDLLVPTAEYYTQSLDSIRNITEKYLFHDNIDAPFLFSRLFRNSSITTTFIKDDKDTYYQGQAYKCFSRNLHLYQSGSKLETQEIALNALYTLEFFYLSLYKIELFDPPGTPQVFLGIHSPFVPINPILDGHPLRSGYSYTVNVQLDAEEHLLPPPYQTNCRDNGPSKDAINFTNPNSFEMCLEMCGAERSSGFYNCDGRTTMIFSQKDFCNTSFTRFNISFERTRELEGRRVRCVEKCRPGCLKLQYKHKIDERKFGPYDMKDLGGLCFVHIYVGNKKFTLKRHVPLYGSGEMFSHIGGLLGYWLGISVITLLVIIEKFFRAFTKWRRKFIEEKLSKTTSTEITV